MNAAVYHDYNVHPFAAGKHAQEENVIDFTFIASGAEAGPIWGRSLLAPLAPGALTPFTASWLTEVAARAWRLYYGRLDFDLTPRTQVVRLYAGHPYLNLTLAATLDAENAGVTPPSFRVDGQDRPLVLWEKPGFLAGMKLNRGAKKIDDTLRALMQELPAITAKAATWHTRVAGLHWSQAEVLQIMEEIEHVGAAALLPYFAARHNLETAYHRLHGWLGAHTGPAADALIVRALGKTTTVELELAQHVAHLGQRAAAEPAVRAWLAASHFEDWATTLPSGAFATDLHEFLAHYGQRGLHEGEIAAPRWAEAPDALLVAIRACTQDAVPPIAASPADPQPLLTAIDAKHRKEAQQIIEQMRTLLTLQSGALHAAAYILAGTRRWALAAGREALVDQRITTLDDIFFYAVEEVKEMMTGEWNVSDRSAIHATAVERRQALAAQRHTPPADLLWGDRAATRQSSGLPAALGAAEGDIVSEDALAALSAGAIVLRQQPESAAAILLPAASAFVTAEGSPLDPLCTCARSLGRPGVVAARTLLATFASSGRVAVDGTLAKVTIL